MVTRYVYDLTPMQLRFDRRSTALRQYVTAYLFWAAALRPQSVSLRLAGYVIVTLMTFGKQSNARRIEIESYCNHRINDTMLMHGDGASPRRILFYESLNRSVAVILGICSFLKYAC